MAITSINVGNIANDGTGDDLREAFIKVNSNFEDVDSRIQDTAIEAVNIGTGAGVYADKDGSTLQFKTLVAGASITLTPTDNSVVVNAETGVGTFHILSDSGSLYVNGQTIAVQSGDTDVLTTRVVGDNIFIDLGTSNLVERDIAPKLGANLNANNKSIIGANSITAGTFSGNLIGTVHGIDVRDINQYFEDYWDFGEFLDSQTYSSIIEWMIGHTDIDMGDISGAGVETGTIDLGVLS